MRRFAKVAVQLSTLFIIINSSLAFAVEPELKLDIKPLSEAIYEPFSGLAANQNLKIEFTNNVLRGSDRTQLDNSTKRLKVLIFQANEQSLLARGDQQNLHVQLLSNSQQGRFRKIENLYQHSLRPQSLNRLREQELEFTIHIPESQFAEPGIFRLPLEVQLVDIESEQVLDEQTILVEISVSKRLQANIAGAQTNSNPNSKFAVVNFGVLKTNDSRRVSIQVRGNTSAQVKVSSENRGRLVHTKDSNLFINYSVDVDGEVSELNRPLWLSREVDKTLSGVAYPMDIIIGDAENKFAGQYRDIITVEVRPR